MGRFRATGHVVGLGPLFNIRQQVAKPVVAHAQGLGLKGMGREGQLGGFTGQRQRMHGSELARGLMQVQRYKFGHARRVITA